MFDPFNMFDPFGAGRRRINPASFFLPDDVGWVYDTQNLQSMFQDVAGTVPANQPGHPVGLRLDLSGKGNHATQSVAASRPTLARRPASGVRNLLTNTDAMGTQSVAVAAVAHTLSFTGAGTVTLSGASSAGPLVGTGAGNRVSLTFTPAAGNLTLTVTGSVTLAQLELGLTATAYQQVGSVYDVTEAGQPDRWCLVTDGVDDGMVTPTITPAVGADKVQVVAGVRKLSDATAGIVVEYGPSVNSTNGTFVLYAPSSNRPDFGFVSRGTALGLALTYTGYPAPITGVTTGLGDIAGDSAILRVNGAQVAASTADQGTGQIGTYPAYLYRRGGSTVPTKLEDYGVICRISTTNLSDPQIGQLEAWANQRPGAY